MENFLSVEEQISLVTSDPDYIIHINNPCEAVQLATVDILARNIKYIKNPTLATQLLAVKYDIDILKYITDPHEEVRRRALCFDWAHGLKYVSTKLQLEAVANHGLRLQYIPNPCLAVQLKAVKSSALAIKYIGLWIDEYNQPQYGPNLEVQLEAVKNDVTILDLIPNPCYAVQMCAVKRSGHALRHINNPYFEVQVESFKNYKESIEFITDVGVLKEVEKGLTKNEINNIYSNLLYYARNPEIIHHLLNHGVSPYQIDDDNLRSHYYEIIIKKILDRRIGCRKIIPYLRRCKWYRLDKLVRSREFCEWYYAPENRGGIRAKENLNKLTL
jgi:hypothetical protein